MGNLFKDLFILFFQKTLKQFDLERTYFIRFSQIRHYISTITTLTNLSTQENVIYSHNGKKSITVFYKVLPSDAPFASAAAKHS